MSHTVIINGNGSGPGGAVVSRIEWKPSHDLSGNEQMRRVEKVQHMLERAHDVLYAPAPADPLPGD